MGFGQKSSFLVNKNQPPYYNMPTMFDIKHKTQHVYTFGISREYYKKVINFV